MRTLRIALIVVLVSLLLTACSSTPSSAPAITWNGTSLEGARFFERVMGGVTVHYAIPTSPVQVEQIAVVATTAINNLAHDPLAPVDIWVVPRGAAWPKALPIVGAVNANVIVTPEESSSVEPPDRTSVGPGSQFAYQKFFQQPLIQAIFIAVTQPKGSPAYTTNWLRDGVAGFIVGANQPYASWMVPLSDNSPVVLDAQDLMRALEHPTEVKQPVSRFMAPSALLALVIDRWGSNWWAEYPRTAAEMTPANMLLWATGAPDEGTAVTRWQERMDTMMTSWRNMITRRMRGQNNVVELFPTMTAVDASPVRVTPKLALLPQGPGVTANYSPHRYDLTVRFAPEKHEVAGNETLTWHNGEGVPIDTLYFNLWPNAEQIAQYGSAIKIEKVLVDGKAVDFKAQALDLVVPLGRPIPQGEAVSVAITFNTRLPLQVAGRINLTHWFPILAVLDDRGWNLNPLPTNMGGAYSETADYHVSLDLPAGTQLGATGHRTIMLGEGDRWFYNYDAPNVRDWVATFGKELITTDVKVGHTTIHAIDKDLAWTKAQSAETAKALALFEAKFGPYPYDDLVVTSGYAGMAYPQLIYSLPLIQQSFTLDGKPGPSRPLPWRETTYRAVGHQWFYGLVGNDQYSEPWLAEGFARYAERLGSRAFGETGALGDLKGRTLPPTVNVSSSTREYLRYDANYIAGVYDLGAATLEDLEALLGSERFTQVMKTYVKQFQFKTATTANFVRVAEEVSGQSLTKFFLDHKVNPADRAPYTPLLPLGVMKIQP